MSGERSLLRSVAEDEEVARVPVAAHDDAASEQLVPMLLEDVGHPLPEGGAVDLPEAAGQVALPPEIQVGLSADAGEVVIHREVRRPAPARPDHGLGQGLRRGPLHREEVPAPVDAPPEDALLREPEGEVLELVGGVVHEVIQGLLDQGGEEVQGAPVLEALRDQTPDEVLRGVVLQEVGHGLLLG